MAVPTETSSQEDVPAHVPDELVRHVTFATAPGAEIDPYAANKPLLDGPPIFYSPLMKSPTDNGTWVVTRTSLIREILTRPESFSSADCSGLATLAGGGWDLIPLEKDPPDHLKYRVLLNPVFAPNRMAEMEDNIRGIAVDLIDRMLTKDECEFDRDFGRPFPASIFLNLMGLPLELTDQFVEWELTLLQGETFEIRAEAAQAVRDYLVEVIHQRRAAPIDDLISFTVQAKVAGQPLTDDEILGICYLLFVGGLDTVTSTLGFMFKHLAEDQENQQRLSRSPEIIPAAMEEMLRAFAVVNSPRHVSHDMTFHGINMKKGDRIVLAMTIAGRDDREYSNADLIDFDRGSTRHVSFATGPHNCIGQHLARRELRIALEEWMKRVPRFKIKAGKTPITHGVTVFGVHKLPLTWSAA